MIANLVKKSIVSLLFACVGIGYAGGELRDRSMSFSVPEGSKYSFGVKLHNAREYHWAASPKSTILSLAGRKWTLSSYQGYDSFTTFSGQSPAEKLAMKSFVFEETPLLWNFSREEIDGRWYNRAYTDTGLDLMAPEGQRKYVSAPKWYTAERRLKKKRAEQEAHNRRRAAILLWAQEEREAKRRAAEGHYHEALWAALESINRIEANQLEESRDSAGMVAHYWEKAKNYAADFAKTTWNYAERFVSELEVPGRNTTYDLYAEGKISRDEFLQRVGDDISKTIEFAYNPSSKLKVAQIGLKKLITNGGKKFAEAFARADKPSVVNKITASGKSGGKNPLKIQKNQPKTEKIKPENLQKEQVGKTNATAERKIGQSGQYKRDLTEDAPFYDGMEAHHMPSQHYLKANKMDPDKGFAAMMPKKQHGLTRTYKGKANVLPTDKPYRKELATDIKDYVEILKKEGLWKPDVRRSLMQGLDKFKKEFPDLFKKVSK